MKLPWQKKTGEDGSESIEVNLPDDLKTKLDSAASKDEVTALSSKFDELKSSIASISNHFTEEAETRRKAAETEARRKAGETQVQNEEELNELFLTNPVEATKKLLQMASQPANNALLQVRADSIKREVFEDQDKFPYYTGELKADVDKLLAKEPLVNQNNREVIEHAYFSVLGRKSKDLAEGKLKSRFASAEGSRGTNGNLNVNNDNKTVQPLDDDGKKVARMLGFTEDIYAKMLHEEGVGHV